MYSTVQMFTSPMFSVGVKGICIPSVQFIFIFKSKNVDAVEQRKTQHQQENNPKLRNKVKNTLKNMLILQNYKILSVYVTNFLFTG